MTDEIMKTDRIATASIRGYYYQFLWTVKTWLALGPQETLLCEGNEDIDRYMGDAIEHTALKHLSGTLTEKSHSVREVIGNFAEEFVFQRRRGKKPRFIFRTTATLVDPKEHPLLTPWLSGARKDVLAMQVALLETVRSAGARKSYCALRYIRRNGLMAEFLNSVSWSWAEIDYQRVREVLVEQVRSDERFAGLSPGGVVERLLSQIIHASSGAREDLQRRRLTSVQVDSIACDLALEKSVHEFDEARSGSLSLYFATAHATNGSLLMLGRFGSREATRTQFARLAHRLANRPVPSHRPLFSLPLREDVLAVIGALDVDFYAIYFKESSLPKDTREQRLSTLLAKAVARFPCSSLLAESTEYELFLRQWCVGRNTTCEMVDDDDYCFALTNVVAELLLDRMGAAETSSWRTFAPWAYHKIRYVFDSEGGTIFTQKNPLT